MSPKHRILFHTDPTWLNTGLAEGAKPLLKYLYKTGKYEIAMYCAQGILANDPQLNLTPWKTYHSIPADQNIVNQLNADPIKARNAAYGAYRIDEVIKEFKPTIYIGKNDSWGFPRGDYHDKKWFNKINSALQITIDSLPINKEQLEQAANTKNYFTIAKFAQKEMHRLGNTHANQMYECMDADLFAPISDEEKAKLRQQFGIAQDAKIFLFVFRNQLRKQANLVLEAFAKLKKQNPTFNVKLLFHTSFSEKSNGWDLEATRDYLGIDPNDLLCTYVCKHCGNWHVAPYKGEDINCPICGAEKKCITVNIKNGVPTQEMKYIYGMCDGGISAFSSGGQELHSSQTMLCGLPLACTNYSCGTDFCTEETKDFVFPISYHHYHEHGTNYIKAASDPSSIADFMRFVCKESKENLKKIGKLSREWAYNQFSIDIIGPKWEAYFDSLPIIDWDKINLEKEELKNPNYPMPFFAAKEDGKYVVALYKNILNMEVDERDGGFQNWMGQLANKKMSRKDVYDYFIKVAKQENDKILNPKEQKVNFESILDKTGNKRAIIVMKESIGDLVILSSVFASFKDRYQNTDLYLATSPKYFDILKGNPHIHKFIPYMPEMESELWCTGQGSHLGFFDYYLNPAIFTQRQLNYLTQKSPVFTVAKD